MKHLADAIGEIVPSLHPERAHALSRDLIARGDAKAVTSLSDVLSSVIPAAGIKKLHEAALNEGVSCRDLGLMLAAASASAASALKASGSTELVWTGPTSDLVSVRRTEQVLTGLVDAAESRVFLVSFVAYKVGPVIAALHKAVARGVVLKILLEKSADRGGTVTTDSAATLKANVPGAKIYEWSNDPAAGEHRGSMHAKCAVADGKVAFVTSANLTEAAMERNMELGVLLRGGPSPRLLEQHLEALITTRLVRAI